jgi:hypothetical protein
MGRQLSVKVLETKFSQKEKESISYGHLCSPAERSFVRKMGYNYSPQLHSKNLETKTVSNKITAVVVEP